MFMFGGDFRRENSELEGEGLEFGVWFFFFFFCLGGGKKGF